MEVLGIVTKETSVQENQECSREEKESGAYKGKSHKVVICQELGLTMRQERKYLSLRDRLSWVILG